MKEIRLNLSPVVFCENPHGYRLGDVVLSGVTGLIHSVLRLGVYPDASEYVRNVRIPRAGEYGSSVHRAIESFDNTGLKITLHTKSERFRESPDDEYWDVADELESYIANREGYEPIANEYTVSDEERYASNIDNVWRSKETGGIWLVDTKTNNLVKYPGGESGLKEYLSWQLSIYAYLFERQNPGLRVEGLAANWLRKTDSAFWTIERQPDEKVKELLSVMWSFDDYGKMCYHAMPDTRERLLGTETFSVAKVDTKVPMSAEAVNEAAEILLLAELYAEKAKQIKEHLKVLMESAGVSSWDNGRFKATVVKESVTARFDSARLKKDNPELYEQYVTRTVKKSSITVRM